MGKQTQRKQEIELEKQEKYFNTLKSKRFPTKVKDRITIKEEVLKWFDLIRSRFTKYELRQVNNFFPLRYNKELLKYALVKYMYVKYPVPDFLLKEFVNSISQQGNMSTLICKWFFDITTGKSFYKENKDYFSKKEAHLFTNISGNMSMSDVILWVRCKSRGIPKDVYSKIKSKPVVSNMSRKHQWTDFLDFVARNLNRKMDTNCIHQMIDYIANHPSLKFKGRTWNSVKRKSDQWHKFSHWASYAVPYMEWNNYPNFNWEHTDKVNTKWKIIELNNSEELLQESIAMNHCVVTYKNSCYSGQCRIFKLVRNDDLFGTNKSDKRCLTIELRQRQTYQIRGNYNRKPSEEESKIIRLWETTYLPKVF